VLDHPFLDFLYKGNPVMPGPTGWKISALYYLLKGEFFWWIVPDEAGKASWLPIPPTWVQETPGLSGGAFKFSLGSSNKTITVDPEFFVWVRDPDITNPYGRGAGVGDSLRDEIDSDEYAARLMRTVLANKGHIDGVLSIEGEASHESKRALRHEFERQHRGTSEAGKVLVLDRATKFTPMAHAFSELKLLELRGDAKEVIEETFGVPPEIFGKVSNSNRATIYEATNIFARNQLVPKLSTFALEIGTQLLPLFDKSGALGLWYVSPVPQDTETRKDMMKVSPQSFTTNEVRAVAQLPPVPWGDVRYVEARFIEVPAPTGGRGRKALGEHGEPLAPPPSDAGITAQKKSP
jgi:HK97 family phage portal protein